MTGKLIKYEIRSSIRIMGVVWAALMAAAILLSVSSKAFDRILPDNGGLQVTKDLISVVLPLIFMAIFVAVIVITVLIVVLRFYRGLLGDEGYLMHTLPVKPWQLITSKGLVAAGIVIISSVVAMLSIVIISGIVHFSDVLELFKELWNWRQPKYILIGIEVLIIMILSVLKSVYQIYAAMAIGQLAGKYRKLLSLGAYIAISVAVTIVFIIIISVVDLTGIDVWLTDAIFELSEFATVQMAIAVIFVFTAAQLAAFHVITERILTLKLNLQ